MTAPETRPKGNFLGIAMLGVAVLLAAFVAGAYLVMSGGDDEDAPPQDGAPFGGTPFPNLPGMPTPIPNTGPLEPGRPALGQPAPDFALVDARDSSRIRKLSDFAGTPVVLNWYASWCGPCREELPAFEAAQTALGPRVAFLGINFLEERDAATSILDETGATFPAVLDPNGAVSDHYRVTGLPITMFLDRDGIVRSIHVGGVTGEELADELEGIGLDYEPAG
jgi:thiol-disulfide isomerase/thioredoxin